MKQNVVRKVPFTLLKISPAKMSSECRKTVRDHRGKQVRHQTIGHLEVCTSSFNERGQKQTDSDEFRSDNLSE